MSTVLRPALLVILAVASGLLFVLAGTASARVADTRYLQTTEITTTKHGIRTCGLDNRYVYLTFDDYGSLSQISRQLKILKRFNVKAIFFYSGNWTVTHRGLMDKIEHAGHLTANHGYTHRALGAMSSSNIRNQIHSGWRGNMSRPLLRPPFGNGAFSSHLKSVTSSMGYQLCFWTIDTEDWKGRSAASMVSQARSAHRGDVILMHSHGRHTTQALPGMIRAICRCTRQKADTPGQLNLPPLAATEPPPAKEPAPETPEESAPPTGGVPAPEEQD